MLNIRPTLPVSREHLFIIFHILRTVVLAHAKGQVLSAAGFELTTIQHKAYSFGTVKSDLSVFNRGVQQQTGDEGSYLPKWVSCSVYEMPKHYRWCMKGNNQICLTIGQTRAFISFHCVSLHGSPIKRYEARIVPGT